MVVLGITGGIASGKSTVARLFRERGAIVIEADDIARQLMRPGSPLLQEVFCAFGPAIRKPGGSLNRAALARLIFQDAEDRERLNRLTHPPILAEMARQIEEFRSRPDPPPLVVAVIPLLFESGCENMVDQILVTTAPEDLRLRRMMERDHLTETDARQRIAAQWPPEQQVKRAHWVIDTGGPLAETKAQAEKLWPHIMGSPTKD